MGSDSPARVLVVSRDLIFKTKISALARESNVTVTSVRSLSELQEALHPDVRLVLVDLGIKEIPPREVVECAQRSASQPRIVGYYSHVEHEVGEAAREAGIPEIVARSKFVQRLPDLLLEATEG